MGCAERQRIAELGDSILVEGSAARRESLSHAEECPECRRLVAAVDPTLVVSDLAPLAVSRSEIETVKSQVLAMRRVRRLERVTRAAGSRSRRWAAVAALTAAILLVADDGGRRVAGDRRPDRPEAAPVSADYSLFGSLPLAGPTEASRPRIYRLDDEEEFSLVWVVDPSLEVPPR